MTKKLIYNLGRRGFFSEINNMILAKIYAKRNDYDFVVNSFYWNCRYKKGLRDYFKLPIEENNNILSAQQSRNKRMFVLFPRNSHDLFYNITGILNSIYCLVHKNVILGNEIFQFIRSEDFIQKISGQEYMNEVRNLLLFSTEVDEYITRKMSDTKLPIDYLGVHIRRGDKITTGEMEDISLEQYVDAIKSSNLKNVYIATDDTSVIAFIKDKCAKNEIKLYYNNSGKCGFREGQFNHSTRRSRYEDTLNLLFDIAVLSKSEKFIGTYSSNLSRVIPCFIGEENCISLDERWHVG